MKFNPRRWIHEHSLKLLAIRDTPEAIAGGVAIGVFFAFAPIFGLKTVLTIFFAWVTRSNIIAAVLAVTAHDLILPLMPVIYYWEYGIGYTLLNHAWPPVKLRMHGAWQSWHSGIHFLLTVGKPLLIGGVLFSAPLAGISYFLTKTLMVRHHRRKAEAAAAEAAKPAVPPAEGSNPS